MTTDPTPPMKLPGFAIASLVCGVFGVLVGGYWPIPALLFAAFGLSQSRDGGRGWAVAALLVGTASVACNYLRYSH